MSLLWRDRVLLGLSPNRISALHVQRGLKPRLIARKEVLLATSDEASLVDALAHILKEEWNIKKAEIEVVVSSHYASMIVVPGSKELKTPAERDALARIQFSKAFSDNGDLWEQCVSPAPLNQSTLACRMPTSLLNPIRQAATEHGKLISIRPFWMDVCNRYKNVIGEQDGLLVAVETKRIVLGSLKGGHWESVTGRFVDTDNVESLHSAVNQQLALCNYTNKPQVWLCNLTTKTEIESFPGWQMQSLPNPVQLNGIGDALFAWEGLKT